VQDFTTENNLNMAENSEKKLFLLDGNALVYRAHFAFITRPLINSKGLNTSAITGFVRTLWDLMINQKPSHIAVAFDPKGGTFRHDFFPEYKAGRDETPEDIKIAFPYIRKIVEAFNIPIVEVPNYEADDTIGTLCKQAEEEGFQVYMVTPDKDYAQLVSENIFMYKPSRQGNGVDILGEKEILEKWDIDDVLKVIDVLGLQGDSVDNIPGVPGIGPKTAVKLLKQFGTLEGILAGTDQLKGKQKENLENFAEQARLSYRLATIDLNVPIQFDAERYIIEPFDKPKLEELFKELEFRSLATQILGQGEKLKPQQGDLFATYERASSADIKEVKKSYSVAKTNITTLKHDYQLIDTSELRKDLVSKLEKQKSFSFDTETTNIDANLAELVGLVFSYEEGVAYYVPTPEDQAETKAICAEFKGVLEDPEIEIVGQNIKYDALVMKWNDVELGGDFFDTMIAHYLCEPDMRHKLDYLAEAYLDYKMVPITDIIGKAGKNQLTMRDVTIEKAKEYAGEDADMTLRLQAPFTEMMKENKILDLYQTMEAPLIKVLTDVEFEGVRINKQFLNDYSVKLGEMIADIKKEIYSDAGVDFNIASPKQVGQVLFEKLEIPYRWKKTSSGQYSTDVEKLTELAPKHEVVNKILTYRKYSKLKSTYVDALPLMINPKTGRIHSNFNQARAATGRLSSDKPNLQNIPIRDEAGREIRKAFEPRDENHILLAADYSQIELRLIAEISGDEAMMEAFINGNDFHRATAAKVYDTPYDEVTDDQRRNAKTVNFSITYGAGATNLSKQLGIKRTEATELIENYFMQFEGLKRYMDDTIEFARANGYVKTMLGRRRNLRDINSKNGLTRSNAERMAINTPVQGTAADMIKIAMINIHKAMKDQNLKSKMILQVHDELVFDVYKPELEELKVLVENLMKTAMPNLKVPILVGMDTGSNWLEAH
jgi:DNA polymerase-1